MYEIRFTGAAENTLKRLMKRVSRKNFARLLKE